MLGMRNQPNQPSKPSVRFPSSLVPLESDDIPIAHIKGFEGVSELNAELMCGNDAKVLPDARVGPALRAVLSCKPRDIRKAAEDLALDCVAGCNLSSHLLVILNFLREDGRRVPPHTQAGEGEFPVDKVKQIAKNSTPTGERAIESHSASSVHTTAEKLFDQFAQDVISRDLAIPLVDRWLQQRKGTKEKHNTRTAAYALLVALLEIDYASHTSHSMASTVKAHPRSASLSFMCSLTRTLRAVKTGGVAEDGRLYLGILEIFRRFAEARNAHAPFTIQGCAADQSSPHIPRTAKESSIQTPQNREFNPRLSNSQQGPSVSVGVCDSGARTSTARQYYGGYILSVCAEQVVCCVVPSGGSEAHSTPCTCTKHRRSGDRGVYCVSHKGGEDGNEIDSDSDRYCGVTERPGTKCDSKYSSKFTQGHETERRRDRDSTHGRTCRDGQSTQQRTPTRANGKAAKAALAVCRAVADFELNKYLCLPTASLFLDALSDWDFKHIRVPEMAVSAAHRRLPSQLIRFLIKDAARLLGAPAVHSKKTTETNGGECLNRAQLAGVFKWICNVVDTHLLTPHSAKDVTTLLKAPLAAIGKQTCPMELFSSAWECGLAHAMHGPTVLPSFVDEIIDPDAPSVPMDDATSLALFLITKVVPKLGYEAAASSSSMCKCDLTYYGDDSCTSDAYVQAFIVRLLEFCMEYRTCVEMERTRKPRTSENTHGEASSFAPSTTGTQVECLWLAYMYRRELAFISREWTHRLAAHIAGVLQKVDPLTRVTFIGRREALVTATAQNVLLGAVERWLVFGVCDSRIHSGGTHSQRIDPSTHTHAGAEEGGDEGCTGSGLEVGGLPMCVIRALNERCGDTLDRMGCGFACECGCEHARDYKCKHKCRSMTQHSGKVSLGRGDVAAYSMTSDAQCLATESSAPNTLLVECSSSKEGEYGGEAIVCMRSVHPFDPKWVECLVRYAVQSCCMIRHYSEENHEGGLDNRSNKPGDESKSSESKSNCSDSKLEWPNSQEPLSGRTAECTGHSRTCDVCDCSHAIWANFLSMLLRSSSLDCTVTTPYTHINTHSEHAHTNALLELNPLQTILVRAISDGIAYGEHLSDSPGCDRLISVVEGADYNDNRYTVVYSERIHIQDTPPATAVSEHPTEAVAGLDGMLSKGAYTHTGKRGKEVHAATSGDSRGCVRKGVSGVSDIASGPKVVELSADEDSGEGVLEYSAITAPAKLSQGQSSGSNLTVGVDGVRGLSKAHTPIERWGWDGTAVWNVLLSARDGCETTCTYARASTSTNTCPFTSASVKCKATEKSMHTPTRQGANLCTCNTVRAHTTSVYGVVLRAVCRHVVGAWKHSVGPESSETDAVGGSGVKQPDEVKHDWARNIERSLDQTHSTVRRPPGCESRVQIYGASVRPRWAGCIAPSAHTGTQVVPHAGYFETLLHRIMSLRHYWPHHCRLNANDCACNCETLQGPGVSPTGLSVSDSKGLRNVTGKRGSRAYAGLLQAGEGVSLSPNEIVTIRDESPEYEVPLDIFMEEVVHLAQEKPGHNAPTVMLRAIAAIISSHLTGDDHNTSTLNHSTNATRVTAAHRVRMDAICTTVLRTLLRYTGQSLRAAVSTVKTEYTEEDTTKTNTNGEAFKKPLSQQAKEEAPQMLEEHGLFTRLSPLLLLRCLPVCTFHERVTKKPFSSCANDQTSLTHPPESIQGDSPCDSVPATHAERSGSLAGARDSTERSVSDTMRDLMMQYIENASEYIETRKVAAELLSRLCPERGVCESLETVAKLIGEYEGTVATLLGSRAESHVQVEKDTSTSTTGVPDTQALGGANARARSRRLYDGLVTSKLLIYTCNLAIVRILKSGARSDPDPKPHESSSPSHLHDASICHHSTNSRYLPFAIFHAAAKVFSAASPCSECLPVESIRGTSIQNERLRLYVDREYGDGSAKETADALRKLKLGVSDLLGISILALSETEVVHEHIAPTLSTKLRLPSGISAESQTQENPLSKVNTTPEPLLGTRKTSNPSVEPHTDCSASRNSLCESADMVQWVIAAVATPAARVSKRHNFTSGEDICWDRRRGKFDEEDRSRQSGLDGDMSKHADSGGDMDTCAPWLIFALGCALRLAVDKGLFEHASTRQHTFERVWAEAKPFLLSTISGSPVSSSGDALQYMHADVGDAPARSDPQSTVLHTITAQSVLKSVAETHYREMTDVARARHHRTGYLQVPDMWDILRICIHVLHAPPHTKRSATAMSSAHTDLQNNAIQRSQSVIMATRQERERLQGVAATHWDILSVTIPVLRSLSVARTRRQFNASSPPLEALRGYLERLIGVEPEPRVCADARIRCNSLWHTKGGPSYTGNKEEDDAMNGSENAAKLLEVDADKVVMETTRRRLVLYEWIDSVSVVPSEMLRSCEQLGGGWGELYVVRPSLVFAAMMNLKALHGIL
ncbi:hypothetical protein SARC_07863 [Sphaeroforma arctica JP610]|uniref:Uncharacterized protein n=1 Tax=Sphaeroforma arctica JP610 TaxID=667725 RepID=A0A0L0FT62_9EUKA|nr:hypothetical protein SARC_07863 [Sphaeroforma arctica JP610]KNC79751.1 hypothetical protein SARC_07863 [Sphaeroforma arctica JP610]|eukprot:XP_014153653.1 hypothetical protein SARC_07863 [Sphaeroforma arctica JP610]